MKGATTWNEIYTEVVETVAELGGEPLIYRGQCNADWGLLPSLARLRDRELSLIEDVMYFDFITKAAEILPRDNSSWDNFFTMQHHGIPTRLLDWSETFGVALYFAIKGCQGDAAIWVLDPFELNRAVLGREEVLHPTDLPGTYHQYYIGTDRLPFEGRVAVLSPLRNNRRIAQQRAIFTLHDDLDTPLETAYPDLVRKIIIPAVVVPQAEQFLRLAGVTEYILFPDLDGLARELKREYRISGA